MDHEQDLFRHQGGNTDRTIPLCGRDESWMDGWMDGNETSDVKRMHTAAGNTPLPPLFRQPFFASLTRSNNSDEINCIVRINSLNPDVSLHFPLP